MGGGCIAQTEVAFLFLSRWPWVYFWLSPKFISVLLKFINGSGLRQVDRGLKMLIESILYWLRGKVVLQKRFSLTDLVGCHNGFSSRQTLSFLTFQASEPDFKSVSIFAADATRPSETVQIRLRSDYFWSADKFNSSLPLTLKFFFSCPIDSLFCAKIKLGHIR